MNTSRIFTALLAVGLALGFACQPLRAGNYGDLTYAETDWFVQITNCATTATGDANGVLTIPNSINGKVVAAISGGAFNNCTLLKGVVLPTSVQVIQGYTFLNCTSLTSVTIPSNITGVADYAFQGCTSLASATFQGNAPTMGSNVFSGTASGFTVNYDLSKSGFTAPTWNGYPSVGTGTTAPLTYRTNGTGLSVIDCDTAATGTLTIPSSIYGKSVTSIASAGIYIDSAVFYNCTSLTSVNIPAGVTSIGNYAFYNCSSLTSVSIPASVTSIGRSAFDGCYSLTSASIPAGVTSIGNNTFYNCINLTSVSIPTSVTSIGDGAFYDCRILTNITLPAGVTSIGGWAFYNCNNLTGVSIPAGVTGIGEGAFLSCSNLSSATFQGNAPTMGSNVFGSTALGFRVYFYIGKIGFTYPAWNSHPTYGIGTATSYPLTYTADGTSVTITACATNYSGTLTLPASFSGLPVTSIGNGAFASCNSLTSVTVPASITSIGANAFSLCSSLFSATFQGNAPAMGGNAFDGTALGFTVHYHISNSGFTHPTWGGYPTDGTGTATAYPLTYTADGSRVAVTACATGYSGTVTIPASFSGLPVTSIGANAFQGCISLIGVNIPISVTSIGSNAFQGCSSLIDVIIPADVTSIGNYAFQDCSSLASPTFHGNAPTMGSQVFGGTAPGFMIYYVEGSVGFDSIGYPVSFQRGEIAVEQQPDGTNLSDGGTKSFGAVLASAALRTEVASSSFTFTIKNTGTGNLNGIHIIKNGANAADFVVTTAPAAMVSPGGSTTFVVKFTPGATGNRSAAIHIANNDANESPFDINLSGTGIYDNLNELTYQENANSIVITGCSTGAGGTLSIPDTINGKSVISIGAAAFYDCTNLSSVTLPTSVTSIGDAAFSYSGLSSVTIPPGVTSIGAYAFQGCFYLSYVSIPASVTSIGEYAFEGCSLGSASFFGNAPTMGTQIFGTPQSGFTVFYNAGSTGFDSIGYPTGFLGGKIAIEQPGGTTLSDGGATSFGAVLMGSNRSFTFTIKNNGTGNLTGLTISRTGTNPGDFVVTQNPVAPVPPGGSTTFVIRFTPAVSGNRSAVIHIASNDSDTSKFDINLSGNGTYEYLTYRENANSVDVISCSTSAYGALTIPDTINGKNVVSIGDNAFAYCGNVTSVSLPANLTSIGFSAFYACTGLASVSIPTGVTSLGDYAFLSCSGLSSAKFFANAPAMGTEVFDDTAAGFKVYYNDGKTGFDSIGYPTGFLGGEIAIEQQPAGTDLSDGGVNSFGTVLVGASNRVTFTIKNLGNENLTDLAITRSGTHASDFVVTQYPAVPVPPGGSTSFVLRFAPGASGSRSAAIHIASNDANESPFDITLTGTGTGNSPVEAWRNQYFQTYANTGNAADSADPDHDGLMNQLERAFNLDPTQPGSPIATADTGTSGLPLVRVIDGPGGRVLSIQYLRRKASANSGLTYTPQFSSTLNDNGPGGWTPATGNEIVQSIDAEWERVTVQEDITNQAQRFGRVKVTASP